MTAIQNILNDLYNFDDIEEFNPTLYKTTYTIDNETIKGDTFKTPTGKEVFVYRVSSKYHSNGQQWGNPWNLYNITDNKHLIIGRKTKNKIIEESGRL